MIPNTLSSKSETQAREVAQFPLACASGFRTLRCITAFALLVIFAANPAVAAHSFARVVAGVQPRIVKIYGAGGARHLEAYQSGFLISSEGHVLTVLSYVLDTDFVTVVLDDGRRFVAELIGADPQLEVAVLKLEVDDLPYFRLDSPSELHSGSRVLAFSNLFGVATGSEPASVLHGCVSIRSHLTARRGAFASPYRGPVYILDALTNNPGAAGGALTDRHGELAGLLGKELRNELDNTWLNYAIPIAELQPAVSDILAGKVRPRKTSETDRKPLQPVTLSMIGLVLVPDILAKTPPFVDQVVVGSPAAEAGLRPDDMILFVNDRLIRSAREFKNELTYIDRIDEVRLSVMRRNELVEVSVFAPDEFHTTPKR